MALFQDRNGKRAKNGHLEPPFFVRPFRNDKQLWHAVGAKTFKDAETEAAQVGVGLEAQAQGLTVAELDGNPNRVALAKAIEKFTKNAEASKKQRTVNGYKLNSVTSWSRLQPQAPSSSTKSTATQSESFEIPCEKTATRFAQKPVSPLLFKCTNN